MIRYNYFINTWPNYLFVLNMNITIDRLKIEFVLITNILFKYNNKKDLEKFY
jgi:hypothetical protein